MGTVAATPKIYYDGRAGYTYVNGGNSIPASISAWADQSANGYNAVQNTTADQPSISIYPAEALSNYQSGYNAPNAWLNIPLSPGSASWTMVLVLRSTTQNGTTKTIFWSNDTYWGLRNTGSNDPTRLYSFYGNSANWTTNGILGPPVRRHVMVINSNAGVPTFTVDGRVESPSYTLPSPVGLTTLRLMSGYGGDLYGGDICAFLWYERSLSPSDQANTIAALVDDFNINTLTANDVFCFGDSITDGSGSTQGWSYPQFLQELLPGCNVFSTGISGSTTTQWLTYISNIPASKYDGSASNTVLLLLGTNDAAASTTASTTLANIKTICQTIKTKKPSCRIIVSTVLPRGDGTYNAGVAAINAGLLSSANPPWDDIIDPETSDSQFASKLAGGSPPIYFDGVHLTSSGYRRLANLFAARPILQAASGMAVNAACSIDLSQGVFHL